MEKGHSAGEAGQALLTAYPDDRQREHAARWLGWIAYRMDGRAFRARSINGWVARRWLGLAGFLRALPVLCCLAGAIYLGASYLGDVAVLVLVIIASPIIAACLIMLLDRLPGGRRGRGGGPSIRPAGHALPLRWRWVRFRLLLADAADRGVLRRTGSAYTFADPATAAALAAPYQARDAERARRAAGKAREQATLAARPGRRAALIAFVTKSRRNRLCVVFGVGATVLAFPFFPLVYSPPPAWLTVFGQFVLLAAGMGAAGAVLAWPALPLLHRLSGWTQRKVGDLSRRGRKLALVVALLVAAAAAGALVVPNIPKTMSDTPGPRWPLVVLLVVFAVWIGAFNALLYAGGVAALRQVFHGRLSTLVVAAAVAAALAFPVFPYVVRDRPGTWFFLVWVVAFTMAELGTAGAMAAAGALGLARKLCIWSLRNVRDLSRRGRLFALLVAAAGAGVLVAAAGTALALVLAFVLPAACVAACGLWLGMLALRKTRGKTRWLRLPDAIGAATTGAALLALTEHNLLTAVPATGLLFPVAVWGSIRAWLALKGSDRVFSRAGADITLSLLLGAVLVLFLVWLANVFGMSRPEIAAVRAVADHVGAVADVPWWAWLAVYLVLTTVSLAIVLRPARMAGVRRWQRRLRVVPATETVRRALSGVHIGLLMIVLAGAGASAALPSAFQHELAVAYTVAFQRQLLAKGELAAYAEISQQLSGSGQLGTLAQVVARIHHDDPPPAGDDNATSSEDDLAQHVGALQAATLALNAQALGLAETAQAQARSAGLDTPLRDEADLTDRLTETGDQEQSSDEAQANAQQAGEMAAKVIASTIGIASFGSNEVVQIVREYLSGLVENSGVGDAFAEQLSGVTPPAAVELVEPDQAKLQQEAQSELKQAYKTAGDNAGFDDDPAYLEQGSVPAGQNAVDMANQSVQVGGGSCCAVPGEDDEPPAEGGD